MHVFEATKNAKSQIATPKETEDASRSEANPVWHVPKQILLKISHFDVKLQYG